MAKALREEVLKKDKNAEGMSKVQIRKGGYYYNTPEGDVSRYELIAFIGKEIANGVLKPDPELTDGLILVEQVLYLTRKGNYLLAGSKEYVTGIERIEYSFRQFEKNKPIIMEGMAPEIMCAFESEEVGETFLDI